MKGKPRKVAAEKRGEVYWENSQHWLKDILSLVEDEKKYSHPEQYKWREKGADAPFLSLVQS